MSVPPFLKLTENEIGHLLMLHLVGVAGFLDEDQLILFRRRHVVIEIAQKIGLISPISETGIANL